MLVAAALLVLAASMLMYRQRRYVRIDMAAKFLLSLVAWSFITLAWGYNPLWSFIWTMRLLQWVAVYVLIITLTRTRNDLNHWGHMFLYASFVNLAGLGLELTGLGSYRHIGTVAGEYRASILTLYPCWAVLYLPFALHYLLWGRNRTETALGALSFIVNLATVYASFRRAGPIAVGLVLLTYFVLVGHRHRAFVRLCAMILLAGVLGIILNPAYAKRMSTIPWLSGATLQAWEGSLRLIQYRVGFEIFAHHPFSGIGLNAPHLWIKEVYGFPGYLGQHSILLGLASGLGLGGLCIYALFAISALRRTSAAAHHQLSLGDLRGASLAAAILASLVGMLFWGQVQSLLISLPVYLCAALGSVAHATFAEEASSWENSSAVEAGAL